MNSVSLILTCPECATRYVASVENFDPPGRTVRCSRCEHTWFQDVSDPDGYESLFEEFESEPQETFEEEASEFGDELAEASRLDDQRAYDADEPAERAEQAEMTPRDEFDDFDAGPEPAFDEILETVGMDTEEDARGLGSRIVSRLISGLIALFITIAVLGAMGAGAWYFRPQIIERVPQMEALYALLPTADAPADFDLRNTGYIEAREEGRYVLIVSGEIVNRTERPLSVPLVQVTVSNIQGKELVQWSFKPRGEDIGAGQSRYFETRQINPPKGAQRLRIVVIEDNTAPPPS